MLKRPTLATLFTLGTCLASSALAKQYTYSAFFFYGDTAEATVSQVFSVGSISAQSDDDTVFVMPTIRSSSAVSPDNHVSMTVSYQGKNCRLSFSGSDLSASSATDIICCPGMDASLQAGIASFQEDHLLSQADLNADGSFDVPSDMSIHLFKNRC